MKEGMESKKVYVHYEGSPEFTHVFKITGGLTAEQLALDFTRVYNAKHGRMVSLDPATIHLLNGRRRMSKSANLIRLVKDRSDIFVERELPSNAGSLNHHVQKVSSTEEENSVQKHAATRPETVGRAEMLSGNRGELGFDQQQQFPTSSEVSIGLEDPFEADLASAVRRLSGSNQELDEPFIRRKLVCALEAQQSKKYKSAGDTFRKVLEALPRQQICLRGLGSMALAVCNYSEAVPWLKRGVEEYPLDALFHARLGDAYTGLGKYEEALTEYDLALGLIGDQSSLERSDTVDSTSADQKRDLQEEQNLLGRHHFDPKMVDDPIAGDVLGTITLDGLKISSAAVLGKLGKDEVANAILTTILKQNAENLDALYQYGVLILASGLIKEALRIFVKVLISKPGDERVRSSLSMAIKHPQGLELLKDEVAVEAAAAPALAFLASCVKDHGAIDEAVELYILAIKLSPSSVGYFLNLIHLYEVMYDYLKALGLAVSLFRSLPSFCLNRLQYSDILPYFEGPNWTESPDNISQQCQSQSLKFQAWTEFLRWFDGLPADKQADRMEISSEARHKGQETKKQELKCTYDDQHLDGLAILFTLTKILFFGGALEHATQLARIIEPARAASAKPLHLTLIRNEAAYFASVHQILQQHPVRLPLPSLKEQHPLYLAGDSHCMSAAWRTVQLRGQSRLLVPLLVTGLKVWHLRPESDFYPKYAFENAMQSVADGAQLVMVYGEIDCRESILVSVNKGVYKNVGEGVEVIVNLYLEVLQQLVFIRGFELFVHPVPPVLNETREVVHIFNRTLKQRLEGIKKSSPAGKRLHWLDFVSDLLSSEGSLKEEYKLDGTHLSPRYWSLIQRELQKLN